MSQIKLLMLMSILEHCV